jgi:hypothetical protein
MQWLFNSSPRTCGCFSFVTFADQFSFLHLHVDQVSSFGHLQSHVLPKIVKIDTSDIAQIGRLANDTKYHKSSRFEILSLPIQGNKL